MRVDAQSAVPWCTQSVCRRRQIVRVVGLLDRRLNRLKTDTFRLFLRDKCKTCLQGWKILQSEKIKGRLIFCLLTPFVMFSIVITKQKSKIYTNSHLRKKSQVTQFWIWQRHWQISILFFLWISHFEFIILIVYRILKINWPNLMDIGHLPSVKQFLFSFKV